jgi:2'-5' RNA ligase
LIGFQKSTFISLDFPSEMAEKIRKIRLSLEPTIAWKPVVISLAGSSGCGHISDEQDIFEANKIMTKLSKTLSPISVTFSTINSFPNTDIYFFEFDDESAINNLYEKIKNCGIIFSESEFPFKAHCTIHFKGKITSKKKQQILNTIIPIEKFELNTISFISDYKHLSRFSMMKMNNKQLTGA